MRERAYLRLRYRGILSSTGAILIVCGGLMLTPLLLLIARPEEAPAAPGFLWPACVMMALGLAVWLVFHPRKPEALNIEEGGVIVLLSWVSVCLFSAWPLIAVEGLNFTQAVFESVSGWTTTGLSVVDVTKASSVILLWRSVMQLAGGAGLAVIMLAAITAAPPGSGLSAAEGRGDQLAPQVRQSARIVLILYSAYAAVGVAAYWGAGVPVFEAINHSFAAVSTGGFSTFPDSIGHYDSAAVEAVSLPLMILGNLSFITAWLLARGRVRDVVNNGEVRLTALLLPLAASLLFFLACLGVYPTLGKSLRVAVFEAVTALTTTGFSTVSYTEWSPAGVFVLIVLMIVGGGTCSTAGGLKQIRVYIMYRLLAGRLRRPFQPREAIAEDWVWGPDDKRYIKAEDVSSLAVFLFLYLTGLVVGTLVLAAHGYGIVESVFEYASAQGTVGLSLGVTSANAPPAVLWVETAGMLLGRLEFMVVFTSLLKLMRDGRRMVTGPAKVKLRG